jgi:hypothetical protein
LYTSPRPAAITATPLNPAAASTEGPAAGRAAEVALARGVAAEATAAGAAGATAGGCSGATSVPAGAILPSTAKPQLSRLLAASISVSAGQCSRVTMSVTPCLVAIPI